MALAQDLDSLATLRSTLRDRLNQSAIGQPQRIADAAGMSRRTFFRYFQSKEDLIVEFLGDVGRWLVEALAARATRETHAVAVRRAFSGFVDSCTEHPGRVLRFTKIILADPSLRGHFLAKQSQWRVALAAELARRAGKDVNADMSPTLGAAAAMAAFDTALPVLDIWKQYTQ